MFTLGSITDVRIDWMLRYGNAPRISVEVDRIPELADFRFQKLPMQRGTFYFASTGEAVYFVHHNPRDESGFGGSTYRLAMVDGTTESIKGPWSAGTADHNSVTEPHCVSVAYHLTGDTRGGGCGGYVTVEAMNAALARFVHPEIQLHPVEVGAASDWLLLGDEMHWDRERTPRIPGRVVYELRKEDRSKLILSCPPCGVEVIPEDDYGRKRHAFAVQHQHAAAVS